MGYCVAFNCTTASGQGISLFTFPKDQHRKKAWVVKIKRDGFVPKKDSRLCAKHFDNDQFVRNPLIMSSAAFMPKGLRLKEDAMPTIFDYTKKEKKTEITNGLTVDNRKRPLRKSEAFQKRRRLEILSTLLPNKLIDEVSSLQTTDESSCERDVPNEVSFLEREACESLLQLRTATPEETDNPLKAEIGVGTESSQRYHTSSQTTYNLISRRHVKVQTEVETTEIGIQTEDMDFQVPDNMSVISECSDSDIPSSKLAEAKDDPDWTPVDEWDEIIDEDDFVEDNDKQSTPKDRKFVVFEKNLDLLFKVCRNCGQNVSDIFKKVVGTFVSVETECGCGHNEQWNSQPKIGNMPVGNLVLAGAIMFSGCSPAKASNLFKHAEIANISLRTYNYMQTAYIVPTINSVWRSHQTAYLDSVTDENRKLKLGGDARCCSPGHTAKYGSYSLMDLEKSKIVDVQLVQSNEVKNSNAMELEGLKRCFEKMDAENIQVSEMVTDRHCQVKKYLREERPSIKHFFDVWHMAKGVNSKLEKKGKKRGCEEVALWARSVSNHMYWCAASSKGDGELVQQKWTSILNHVLNIHEGHGDKFTECQHGQLDDREWMKAESKAYTELKSVVKGSMLMKDIMKLSPAEQTSSLESYHKIVCFFAPKAVHFFYPQMRARLYLAVLHFNENSNRKQAVTEDGKPMWSISYPKSRKGAPVAKEVKVKQSYNYVDELMKELLLHREVNPSYKGALALSALENLQTPSPVADTAQRQPKLDVINSQIARFNCK